MAISTAAQPAVPAQEPDVLVRLQLASIAVHTSRTTLLHSTGTNACLMCILCHTPPPARAHHPSFAPQMNDAVKGAAAETYDLTIDDDTEVRQQPLRAARAPKLMLLGFYPISVKHLNPSPSHTRARADA